MRKFVGLKVHFMNAQVGPPGKVKPVRGATEHRLLHGEDAFNTFAEKNKVIADCTPLMEEENGDVVGLEPDDPENALIKVDYYEVIYDGKSFQDDDIQNTPIEVNNHEKNHGCTPRLVFGPGLSGDHTLNFAASINGHRDESDFTLKLNG